MALLVLPWAPFIFQLHDWRVLSFISCLACPELVEGSFPWKWESSRFVWIPHQVRDDGRGWIPNPKRYAFGWGRHGGGTGGQDILRRSRH